MYGFGGNAKKPRRPIDITDGYDGGPELNQQPAPAPIPPPDLGQLDSRTMLNRPQMEPLPEMLTQPKSMVHTRNRPMRPMSNDPIEKARDEAIYGGQMQAELGIKPKRGFWDIMKTAGVGALQGMATGGGLGGAIGGALAGGIGSAISPEAGRGYRFDVMQRPRMEADIARQMAYDKFGREQQMGQAELEQKQAATRKMEAETAGIPAREELQRKATQAQILANTARAENLSRPDRPQYSPEEERRRQERHEKELLRIDAQTKRALRPPSGGGGGGGAARPVKPEKPTSLPEALLKMLDDAEEQRLDAEAAWGMPEMDAATKKPIPGSNVGEKLRQQYVQTLNRIKQYFPDFINVQPGVGEGGKALPEWPYVERRR